MSWLPVKNAIRCGWCGELVDCTSNAQKFCSALDDPECYDARVTSGMTDKQFAKYRGIEYIEFSEGMLSYFEEAAHATKETDRQMAQKFQQINPKRTNHEEDLRRMYLHESRENLLPLHPSRPKR
jgi:hypothetical protein